MDELVALIDAAGEQEAALLVAALSAPETPAGSTRARVAEAVARGLPPAQIAAALGVSKSTVSYHLARLAAQRPVTTRGGERSAARSRAGICASELCDLRIGHVRLHDPAGARVRIPGAKTEAGVREVQMSRPGRAVRLALRPPPARRQVHRG